ncbi:unnamed protein product [Sphenostylis stenocarpa]|uniref:Uncharacterized protein n=1 Tax=Sphenostylis stenocarpa TaxID=92480 RepID=A0AA86SYK7_9FABA|nr:unnamed protein product [Sphenostylis stenocarpa]
MARSSQPLGPTFVLSRVTLFCWVHNFPSPPLLFDPYLNFYSDSGISQERKLE